MLSRARARSTASEPAAASTTVTPKHAHAHHHGTIMLALLIGAAPVATPVIAPTGAVLVLKRHSTQ